MKVFNRDVAVMGRFIRRFSNTVATTGAATAKGTVGKVTSEALTTAQNGLYTLTITNPDVTANDVVLASVANGTNTQGTPAVCRVQPADGSIVVVIANQHASAQALNGTLVVSFMVVSKAR